MTAPIQSLLLRLENVRGHGSGYRANCPRGHSNAKQSLTIRETDDGTVLLKCHVGCGAADVMQAIGLSVGDLFVKRHRDRSPQARQAEQEALDRRSVKALAAELVRWGHVIYGAGSDISAGIALPDMERNKLWQAINSVDCVQVLAARIATKGDL
jgi:hypothetical protein